MQGHLRLILLPIVYNAMAAKESLWKLPLFVALQQAMRASTYNKLLRHPSSEPITPKQSDQRARCCCYCRHSCKCNWQLPNVQSAMQSSNVPEAPYSAPTAISSCQAWQPSSEPLQDDYRVHNDMGVPAAARAARRARGRPEAAGPAAWMAAKTSAGARPSSMGRATWTRRPRSTCTPSRTPSRPMAVPSSHVCTAPPHT